MSYHRTCCCNVCPPVVACSYCGANPSPSQILLTLHGITLCPGTTLLSGVINTTHLMCPHPLAGCFWCTGVIAVTNFGPVRATLNLGGFPSVYVLFVAITAVECSQGGEFGLIYGKTDFLNTIPNPCVAAWPVLGNQQICPGFGTGGTAQVTPIE